ncbi:MAG: cadherin-like domain-containing protein [Akkermansiaceae bacterium]|nr:cadherin-like domain-containing protein [Akkermansiaceae bacterium]
MNVPKLLPLLAWAVVAPVLGASPATLVQSVTHDGETITLRLTLEDLRGAHFELWAQNATGGYDVITPVDERSYLGTVDEYPGAVASGILQDDGTFRGAVYFDRGGSWFTLGSAVQYTRGINQPSSFGFPAYSATPGQAGTTMYGFDVGIDADYDYFSVRAGSDIARTFEYIEFSVAATRALYMQNALLRPYLGRVIIRADQGQDPADGLTGGSYLDALRNEWNTNHTDADRDVVGGISASDVGGGLAWVGVIGTSSAYSVNDSGGDGEFTIIWRHELGHNWGLGHFDGGSPEGPTINSGNQYARMSGPELDRALNHRDGRLGIFDNEGTYTTVNLPPYAAIDSAVFVQTVSGSVVIDVLANDHDPNGHTLSVGGFDATTAKGGTVSQQGQDLVYTAPGNLVGSDWFSYTVADSSGQTATAAVVVNVQPNDSLRLYLPLDETSGTTAADLSVYENSGSLAGTDFATASGPGVFGNAPTLDGSDDSISVSGVQLNSNTVTLTAWIKPGATSNAWSGIIFDRTGGAAGLNIGSGPELRYHWNDAQWPWNSGLVPPADTWSFVALVVEPTRATIHMNSGAGFVSATNIATHAPAAFGTTYVGRDPSGGSRHFNGAIDEARIYDFAMNLAELQAIMDGGGAEAPRPFDGATGVAEPDGSWASAGGATAYEVYLGTDQTSVAAATTASAEFLGSTPDPGWIFDLQPDTQYFWRVDTVKAAGIVAGPVWTFTTASTVFEHGLVAHWKLDEGSGTTTADCSINNNPGTLNGPAWSPGFSGNALTFDGVDDSVTFGNGPSLGGKTDFTVAAWIKTTATSEQVILQQRNGGFNGQWQFRVAANGTVNFYVYGNLAEQFNFNTTTTVNDGEWHYVVAVRDGENGFIYIDGNPVPAATASGTVRDLNASIAIGMGRDIRDNNRPFNGMIDEAKIYRVARSGEEIAAAYNDYLGGGNAPEWTASPVTEADAIKGAAYSATLADDASDADGHSLLFSKVSGPAWLTVAADGTLGGTPLAGDVGPNTWTVEVSDGFTPPVQETLEINVLDAVDVANFSFELPGTTKQQNWENVPGWSSDSLAVDSGVETGQGATDGAWTGFLGFIDPSVWNLTDHVIGAGESFTLLADARITGSGDGLRLMLYYDDAGTRVTVATVDAPLTGSMQEFSLQFNADDVPAAVGKRIGVELDNVSVGWVGFDNIRLVRVAPVNLPPEWAASPVDELPAIEGVAYDSTLADDASDPDGDPLTFAVVSGPAWLNVATDGGLTGTPGTGDTGPSSWTVSVSDGTAPAVEVTLNITVQPDNDGDGIPDGTDPDDDNDGMPDSWESANSLDPFTDDRDGDPDRDGRDNWSEYVADTDPQDPASRQFLTVEPDPTTGNPRIRFSSSAARRYTVEYSDTATPGSWQDLAPTMMGTGSEMTVIDPSGVPRRFYRLRIELP